MSGKVIKEIVGKYIKEECYCGSGNKYKACCKNDEAKPLFSRDYFDKMRNTSFKAGTLPSGSFLDLWGKVSETRCLYSKCNENAIKSHLVSNNILKQVFKNTKMQTIYVDDAERFAFKERGVNEIKTFLGWCGNHDCEVFKEIDNNLYDGSIEHIMLYTLRAFGSETRVKQNALRQSYSLLYYALDNQIISSIFLGNYHGYLDIKKRYMILEHYTKMSKYNKLKFHTFELKSNKFNIFVSSVFQISYDLEGNILNDLNNLDKDSVPIAFNVINDGRNTSIIFSCLSKDYELYKNYFEQLENLYQDNYDLFLRVINNVIYHFCENIILDKDFKIPKDFKMHSFFETDFATLNFKDIPVISYIS